MSLATIVKAYRGPAASLPTLEAGQLGFTTDSELLYIGDGATNHLVGPAPAAGQPNINTNGTAGVVQFASWAAAVLGTDNSLAINALELGTLAIVPLLSKADAFITVHQHGHGLAVGDVIYCSGANAYTKARADAAATADVVGIVSSSSGADDFVFCAAGRMTTGVPAVAAGSVLFLSDTTAGALTTTEPTAVGHISLPIAIVTENAVSMIVYSWRGAEIATNTDLPLAGGTMSGDITLGENTAVALDPAGSADEKYSGITVTGTAGANIVVGDLCYLNSSWKWVLADADAATTSGSVALGLCLHAAADTEETTLLLMGTMRSAAFPASITGGVQLYVSQTAGDMTETIPTGADVVVRVVGWAILTEPNTVYFNPSTDFITRVS
jgi:hypothetical protein